MASEGAKVNSEPESSIYHLQFVVSKIDGVDPPPDWIEPPVGTAETANQIHIYIALIQVL